MGADLSKVGTDDVEKRGIDGPLLPEATWVHIDKGVSNWVENHIQNPLTAETRAKASFVIPE